MIRLLGHNHLFLLLFPHVRKKITYPHACLFFSLFMYDVHLIACNCELDYLVKVKIIQNLLIIYVSLVTIFTHSCC
jgi:hypothetical protein